MIIIKEATEDSQNKYKTLTLKARDYDNNLENLLNCIKDLSTAGHSFNVVVDPDEENSKDRTFGIDGDGCDQLLDINTSTSDTLKTEAVSLELDESIGDLPINEISKLFSELKAKGLSKEEIIKEIERLSEEDTEIIREDQNSIKVILSQELSFDYSTDVEEYEDDKEFVLDSLDIDDTKIAEELLKYFKSYNYNDEFKDIYNLVNRVDVDFENTSIKVYLTISDTTITDEKIKYVFDDFIKDVVLEDDQLNGYKEIDVEPYGSEPYEVGYNGLNDEIEYDSSVISSIEVDYGFSTIGEQKLEIER